ncbi:MAG TPA: peptide chain release factor N(5)-glutamine methyltransferase [Vicinamibacterales bacterium]|nr:peptide chain release factor N(5)-glutamine methyltransferase [Vicinamibacterales bacterium]
MPTEINTLVADARRRLRAAGIPADEASLDARLLAQYALGWDAARLMTHGDEVATSQFQHAYELLVSRRFCREPLAYITGTREFWNLAIEVTPAVLIPRPETELLIETAVEYFERTQPIRIADVCTGSGCVAVGLGREFPRATIVASDISPDALDVARRNVARYGLASRVACTCADLLAGLAGPFDLVVANPPYVPATEAPQLQPEVREFEPAGALFAGEHGLHIVRRLVRESAAALAADGVLMFEFGAGQEAAIDRIVADLPALMLAEVKRDLQDIPRVAVVRRR